VSIVSGQLVALFGEAQSSSDSRFGPAPQRPQLWARLCADGCDRRLAFVVAHPSADFTQHHLLPQLERRKRACLGATTRYVGNDTELLMEQCIQDLGKAVAYLRSEGFERIVLVGHSGGGSLVCYYQAGAEVPSSLTTPTGIPLLFHAEQLPQVDAIALLAPHPSRASVLADWLDPSVIDEEDMLACDPLLDMFNPNNGPPYDADWLERYRRAQVARNNRISDRALALLRMMEAGASPETLPSDRLLTVYRTGADPRFTDVGIDPNGRQAQPIMIARKSNYSHLSMARISTLRSWLSQWSLGLSRADGPSCLARTTVPVLVVSYGADQIVYPSQTGQYVEAAGGRGRHVVVERANHFLRNQEGHQETVADLLAQWAEEVLGL